MKVKELLADPDNWTKGAYARNAHGDVVFARDTNATCFCIMGAAESCYPATEEFLKTVESIRVALRNRNIKESVQGFNDDPATTHADVMSVLNEADV